MLKKTRRQIIEQKLDPSTGPDIALLWWNDKIDEIVQKNRSGLPPRTPLFNKVNFLILNLLIWETVCREEAVFLPPKNLLDRWFSARLRPKFKNQMCLQNPFHLLKEIFIKALRKEFCSNLQDSLYNSWNLLVLKFNTQSRQSPSKLDLSPSGVRPVVHT